MTSILPFVVALTQAADPGHDHSRMAEVIADVVEAERPLFADDESREKTAALITAVAWREGRLGERVEGDCSASKPGEPCKGTPSSYCTLQVHRSSGGDSSLNDDPSKCIRVGLSMLRVSMRACPDFPIAFYSSGPRGFRGERAKRISRDRVALAGRLRAAARAALEAADVRFIRGVGAGADS